MLFYDLNKGSEIDRPVSVIQPGVFLYDTVFCGYHCAVVWNVFRYNAVRPDADPVTDRTAADYLRACTDKNFISNNGDTGAFAVSEGI